MENNIIKENQLEILPKNNTIEIVEENRLPVAKNIEELLPAIIKQKELALIEIKREFYKVKEHHSLKGIAVFLRNVLILFAKMIRGMVLASSRIISFVMFSAIVIISTTIITKNVVNSYYGVKATQGESVYSIYNVKDDYKAKANAEVVSNNSQNENNIEKNADDKVNTQ